MRKIAKQEAALTSHVRQKENELAHIKQQLLVKEEQSSLLERGKNKQQAEMSQALGNAEKAMEHANVEHAAMEKTIREGQTAQAELQRKYDQMSHVLEDDRKQSQVMSASLLELEAEEAKTAQKLAEQEKENAKVSSFFCNILFY